MKLSRRTRSRIRKVWPIAGIGVLAVATVAVIGAALTPTPAPTSTFTPAPLPERTYAAGPVTAAFLGDSYTAGNGASPMSEGRWSALVSSELGWKEKNFGSGGTTYATGSEITGGKGYTERVRNVIAAAPYVVIVSGGGNSYTIDQSQGITQVFTELRAGLPEAKLVALSPFWWEEAFPAQLNVVSGQIKAGVESVGGTYVELAHPLAGSLHFLAKDGVHPNNEGHKFLAAKIVQALPNPIIPKI